MPPAASASDGPPAGLPAGVAVVVPARDEVDRIGATVRAVRTVPGVRFVVVVDDGSRDGTGAAAVAAGADVVRHWRGRGKAAALETGAARVAVLEAAAGAGQDVPARSAALLFVDADLGSSAGATATLTVPVLAGEADMTIAVLPPQDAPGGGHGFVVRLSRAGVVAATGWTPTQPLSGMRCLTREAFEAARPLARGWGVETALTIDLLTAGYRVAEVPSALHHRVTGSDWRGQLHRAGQFRDVARALAVRRVRRATPLRVLRRLPLRRGPAR
jgi:glycosyltransferase involved in cell wall biosynthesis